MVCGVAKRRIWSPLQLPTKAHQHEQESQSRSLRTCRRTLVQEWSNASEEETRAESRWEKLNLMVD